jgi:predicted amino acid-binding ACT domain protein
MWARDFLIIDGVCHPGELIRRYRCVVPSIAVPASSNAVLIQLQGKDRYGVLQAITLMRCYRANIQSTQAQIDIRVPSDILKTAEIQALRDRLKREYPKAYAKVETQAVLGLCRILKNGEIQ